MRETFAMLWHNGHIFLFVGEQAFRCDHLSSNLAVLF